MRWVRGVTWAAIPWYLLAVLAGVGSLWLWQFVLLPYDPAQSLRNSVRSFYDRAAALVAAIATSLNAEQLPSDDEMRSKELNRRLRQLKLSRRAIESQFPGALAPGGWRREQIGQLQLALYAAEQGLVQMVEGAGQRTQLAAIPGELRVPLAASLRALQAALAAGSEESLQTLANQGDELQWKVRQYGAEARSRRPGTVSEPLPAWAVAAVPHRERQPPGGPLDHGRSYIGREAVRRGAEAKTAAHADGQQGGRAKQSGCPAGACSAGSICTRRRYWVCRP